MGDFDYIFLVWIGVVVSEFLRYFCVLHYRFVSLLGKGEKKEGLSRLEMGGGAREVFV